jgi:hypothetical protein
MKAKDFKSLAVPDWAEGMARGSCCYLKPSIITGTRFFYTSLCEKVKD